MISSLSKLFSIGFPNYLVLDFQINLFISFCPKTEFKEFEPLIKFKPLLEYDWFHLKSYSMFQDFSRRSIEFLRRDSNLLNSDSGYFNELLNVTVYLQSLGRLSSWHQNVNV